MVPPEGIDKIQPATLPADFGEWDNGEEAVETQPVEVPAFDRIPSPPPPKPAPRAATARVAVLPAVERPPAAPPPPPQRKPVRRQPEPEPVYVPPQAEDLDEEYEESGKGKGKMFAIIGVAAVVLIGGGAVGYKMLGSKPAAPTQATTTQLATTAANPTTAATPLKPTATPTETPAPAAPIAAETPQSEPGLSGRQADQMNRQLNAPSRISQDLKALGSSQPAPTGGFSASGMDSMGSSPVFSSNSPKVKVEAPKRLNISQGIAVGLLVQKTPPIYPAIAKSAHVSGTVVIQATISKNGTIENPRVVSGPNMLRQAALDAVKTWRFRPYLLDGQPVEVDTTVNVVFNLGA